MHHLTIPSERIKLFFSYKKLIYALHIINLLKKEPNLICFAILLRRNKLKYTNIARLVNMRGLYQSVGCNIALLEYRGYGSLELK